MNSFANLSEINDLTSYEFENRCRIFATAANLDGNIALVRVLTRYKMFVDLSDASVVPHLLTDGFWETPVTQCIARLVKEGDTCLDVGAHLGYYAILMSALAGSRGKVLAIEPNSVIAAILQRTAEINHPGFQVWEGALSNATREMEIHIPKHKTGDTSLLLRADAGKEGFIHQPVLATTLDRLGSTMSFETVDVIKMDAEGAEPLIFEGMKETLKKNEEVKIVMEYSPHLYTEVNAFNEFLLRRFDVYQVLAGFKLLPVSSSDLSQWTNLRSHLDLLLVKKGSAPPY